MTNNTKKLHKVVYTPESQMRTPRQLFRSMWEDLKASRELAWRLFIRDISAEYRQSILGVFWAFFPPIVMGVFFIILRSKNVVNLGETDIPYPVFVLVGTTLWQLFNESLNQPLKTIMMARPMLAKINFPREALVLSAFYRIIFNVMIKSLVILGVFVYFKVQITFGLLLAPGAVLVLILLGLSIGLLLTPLGVLYKDIQSGLSIITQFWFFVTPVVYPPPETFPYSLITMLNPVSPPLMVARDLMTKGQSPHIGSFLVISCMTLVGLIIAVMIYRMALPILIERISS